MESDKKWYVIHTYSGYENKVKANLEKKVHSMGMENEIFRVLVPMEDEVEYKDGKKKISKKDWCFQQLHFLRDFQAEPKRWKRHSRD